MTQFDAGIIIPTYNRSASLQRTLESLACQDAGEWSFEVIVVDDGSTDETPSICQQPFPFYLRYLRQENQGDASARNTGANYSQAEWLVFLDDDVLVAPTYLSSLLQAQANSERQIAAGTALPYLGTDDFGPDYLKAGTLGTAKDNQPVSFADIASNNMSIKRVEYLDLGGMQGLGFIGSDIWCDVDFNYRAYLRGWTFVRVVNAICYHDDYVMADIQTICRRWEKTAYRAAALFQRYPDLPPLLPMFYDKLPIDWGMDSRKLVGRKAVRRIASSAPAVWGLEAIARAMEQWYPKPIPLELLQRWIVGAYIYRGYRRGLQEFNGHEVHDPSAVSRTHG